MCTFFQSFTLDAELFHYKNAIGQIQRRPWKTTYDAPGTPTRRYPIMHLQTDKRVLFRCFQKLYTEAA